VGEDVVGDHDGPRLELRAGLGEELLVLLLLGVEEHDVEDVRDPQCLLAYEMNWQPLPVPHGAPCRLRVETKVGYKMVKYLQSIELVDSYDAVGEGHGGYREDHQYYDRVASI